MSVIHLGNGLLNLLRRLDEEVNTLFVSEKVPSAYVMTSQTYFLHEQFIVSLAVARSFGTVQLAAANVCVERKGKCPTAQHSKKCMWHMTYAVILS